MRNVAPVPTPLEDPEHPAWAFITALKTARARAGMTQKDLGAAAGVSQSAVAQYERGANLPDVETAIKMERALGIRSGKLTGLLGYLPADATRVGRPDVIEAISRDKLLTPRDRQIMFALYERIVSLNAQAAAN